MQWLVPSCSSYLTGATAFGPSSMFQGLPTIYVEAFYLGVSFISTGFLSEPREIPLDGRPIKLVPTDNHIASVATNAITLTTNYFILPRETGIHERKYMISESIIVL